MDGYRVVADVAFSPGGEGRTLVYAQWKNTGSKATQEWSSDAVLEDGWKEVTRAFPQLSEALVTSFQPDCQRRGRFASMRMRS